MHGVSRQALAATRERLDVLLGPGGLAAEQVGDDLLAVTALLDAQPTLRRALTDNGRDPAARATLATRLLSGRVSPPAADLVAAAVRERWARASELPAALEEIGIEAHLAAAEGAGRLDSVEDELFRFGRIVEARPDLRAALVDAAAPASSRRALVRRLLADRAAAETTRLVEHVVLGRRERSLDVALERLVALAAARRQHVVALVRTAVPLTAEHQERLARALAARRGRPVHLNVVLDPDVVGGLKVEIGDEVYDATIASRLDDARRRLAG